MLLFGLRPVLIDADANLVTRQAERGVTVRTFVVHMRFRANG